MKIALERAQVQALVGADPMLAIFAAVVAGDETESDALLSANRSLISAISPDGWTPLHLAAHFALHSP